MGRPGTIVVRGNDLARDLIGQINFGDDCFLLVTGKRAHAATSGRHFDLKLLRFLIPFGLLDVRSMTASLALLPFAPTGVWAGVRLAHRIKPLLFYRLVYAGMFLTGTKLVWDGFFS